MLSPGNIIVSVITGTVYFVACFVAVIELLSYVLLFATPWTAACNASLFFTFPKSLLKLMSTESVMLSNHLILCHLFLLCFQSFPASGSFSISTQVNTLMAVKCSICDHQCVALASKISLSIAFTPRIY